MKRALHAIWDITLLILVALAGLAILAFAGVAILAYAIIRAAAWPMLQLAERLAHVVDRKHKEALSSVLRSQNDKTEGDE